MKEEIKIYVVVNGEGRILDYSQTDSIYDCIKLIAETAARGVDMKQISIHPITIHPLPEGENLYTRNWQDVDLFHRRLKVCIITTDGFVEVDPRLVYSEGAWKNWAYDDDINTPDLHTALAQLVTLEGE